MRRLVPPQAWVRGGHWPRVGVDVVSLSRIARAGEPAVRGLICGEQELAALGQGLPLTAATWAVKEAAVKAAGGRPAGFGWPSVRVSHGQAGRGQLAAFLGGAIGDVTCRPACGRCRYEWQLPAPATHGTAVWGVAGGAVWAIALTGPEHEGRCDQP